MKPLSDMRLAAIFAIITGLGFWAVGVTHILLPRDQLHFATGISARFFQSLAQGSVVFRLHYWAFVVVALAQIGMILGLRSLQIPAPSLWYRCTEAWAILGLAVQAAEFALIQARALAIAPAFALLPAPAQEAVVAIGLPRLDPTLLFGSGLGALWLGTFSLGRLRTPNWPPGHALLGLAGAAIYALVFVGAVGHVPLLIDIGAALGGVVVGPVWTLWLAALLRRPSAERPATG